MILRRDENGGKSGSCQMLCTIAVTLLKICLSAVAFFLAYEGIRSSYYSPKEYTTILEQPNSVIVHLLIFAGGCLLVSLMLGASHILPRHMAVPGKLFGDKERLCRGILLLACLWLAVVGFLYIREHPYYPIGDQLNTTACASYSRVGNYMMFVKGGYIGLYEQQKGLVLLYEILFTLFGDFCYDVAARFHLCLSVVTLIVGYSFLKIVFCKPVYRILYCVMMMFCIPGMIYLPYAYGDLPAICFSMVLFWAMAAYGQRRQRRHVVYGAIAAGLALLMRMNIWVVLIAAGIGMVLLALEKGILRPVLAGLCVILAAWGTVKAVDQMYEYRSGYESGVGIPFILWIAMGLQETDGNPGVYNRYQQTVFEECGFQRELAAQVGKEYIAERLAELRANPAYTRSFFTKKLKMQWLEPLFEGLYATRSFDDEIDRIPAWITDLYYGDLHDTVWKSANYYQSVIYLAFLAFVATSLPGRKGDPANSAGWIPAIAVLGGFLFSIIWETQCRYVLPYFVYMILYAPIGVGRIAEGLCELGRIRRLLCRR